MDNTPSLIELTKRFPDDAAAEAWFLKQRWPDGVRCPHCASPNIHPRPHRSMPFRCRTCRKDFSVKTKLLMHGSNLGYQTWAWAFYLIASNPKGISSVRLGRFLGITQKTAWYLAHRIRDAFGDGTCAFQGPVEVDETYVGGKEKNKHANKRLYAGRGPVGKVPVVGMKDRETNRVSAAVSLVVDRDHLHTFIRGRIVEGAAVYTDDLPAYDGFPHHRSVNHSAKQYVDGDVHTNGIESFWAVLKRGIIGVYHHVSPKHLPRYLLEFTGRYNRKGLSIWHQMDCLADGVFAGGWLPYRVLVDPGPVGSLW